MDLPGKCLSFRRGLTALTLAMAALPIAGHASDGQQPITAGELFNGIMDGSLASWVQDPADRTMLSRLIATSYVKGVADSTQGTRWCPTPEISVQALFNAVLDHLADLPKPQYSENAAPIVAEALAKIRPCP